jgi:hypothetical protein
VDDDDDDDDGKDCLSVAPLVNEDNDDEDDGDDADDFTCVVEDALAIEVKPDVAPSSRRGLKLVDITVTAPSPG